MALVVDGDEVSREQGSPSTFFFQRGKANEFGKSANVRRYAG